MRLLLTSNFPRQGNHDSAAVLKRWSEGKPFEWIGLDAGRYEECCTEFLALGFELRAGLEQTAAGGPRCIFLAGGPPTQLSAAFSQSLATTIDDRCVLAAASGGAMLCSSNLSLFRLTEVSVDQAVRERDRYPGLGYCECEVLPHFNQHPTSFVDKVRLYSEAVPSDIWCIPDGSAIAWGDSGPQPIGAAACLRRGKFVAT